MTDQPRDRFLKLLRASLDDGTLVKLTLGKYRGSDTSLRNLFVRPVSLKAGPHFAFLWRHATRDITKNMPIADAYSQIEPAIGRDFLDAHLFTPLQTAQLQCAPDGTARLRVKSAESAPPAATLAHDREKAHAIPSDTPWLRALGITGSDGKPLKDQSAKFRQINRFAELLTPLLAEAFPKPFDRESSATTPDALQHPLQIVDMGSGKGYLTFALASLLGTRANVLGVEERPELVTLCNKVANDEGFKNLTFIAGRISDFRGDAKQARGQPPSDAPIVNHKSEIINHPDVFIALHACDTATDDAIAVGIAAKAGLIVVAPCCQKELRPQLRAPAVLEGALKHGIFQERQAEFVTDALRALLLESAGYRTRVFEFVSTEHTAKNLMIAAVRVSPTPPPGNLSAVQAFASFYGIRTQRLAVHLGIDLDR